MKSFRINRMASIHVVIMAYLNSAFSTLSLNSRPISSTHLKVRDWLNLLTTTTPSMSVGLGGRMEFISSCMVKFGVLTTTYYLQIFNAIIQSVFINMVNQFISGEQSTQVFLHNEPVNSSLFSINILDFISIRDIAIISSKGNRRISMSLESCMVFNTESSTPMFGLAVGHRAISHGRKISNYINLSSSNYILI